MAHDPARPPAPAPQRFSTGRALFAFGLFAAPGVLAAAVVLPLLRAKWWPIAMGVFLGLSVFTFVLALLAGWQMRPPVDDPDSAPAGPEPEVFGFRDR